MTNGSQVLKHRIIATEVIHISIQKEIPSRDGSLNNPLIASLKSIFWKNQIKLILLKYV